MELYLIAAAIALLQYRHAYEHTDGGIGTAALLPFREQGLENLLVYLCRYEAVELVVPCLRIGILLGGTTAQLHHGSREHVQLGIRGCLLEHRLSV